MSSNNLRDTRRELSAGWAWVLLAWMMMVSVLYGATILHARAPWFASLARWLTR